MTTNEILDILIESDSNHDVFIKPPDVGDFTDEDSADENLYGCHSADKLSRGQLLAPAEIRSRRNEIEDDLKEDVSTKTGKSSTKKSKTTGYTWKTDATVRQCNIFPQGNYSKYLDFSLAELFELFIDEDILNLMREKMQKYSIKRN